MPWVTITAVGPLARSAEDLALALDVMAGPDDIDGAGWHLRLPKPKKKDLRDYKVAVIYSDPVSEVDNAVQKRIRAVADFLRKSEAKVSERARPKIDMQTARTNFNRLVRSAYGRTPFARRIQP